MLPMANQSSYQSGTWLRRRLYTRKKTASNANSVMNTMICASHDCRDSGQCKSTKRAVIRGVVSSSLLLLMAAIWPHQRWAESVGLVCFFFFLRGFVRSWGRNVKNDKMRSNRKFRCSQIGRYIGIKRNVSWTLPPFSELDRLARPENFGGKLRRYTLHGQGVRMRTNREINSPVVEYHVGYRQCAVYLKRGPLFGSWPLGICTGG